MAMSKKSILVMVKMTIMTITGLLQNLHDQIERELNENS